MLPIAGDIESIVYGLILGGGGGGARVKKVQRGTTDLSGTSVDITISAVELTRTIVLIQWTTGAFSKAASFHVGAALTASTTLRLQRYSSGTTCTVTWEVIEFAEGVTVQHLSTSPSGDTATVTISPVDIDRSFVICTYRQTENDYFSDLGAAVGTRAKAALTAPDTVTLTGQNYWQGCRVYISVVEVK